MFAFMSFSVSGSADCDSTIIKNIIKDNDPKIKVEFKYNGNSKFSGRYKIYTNYKDKEDLHKLYNRIRGMASHALLEVGAPNLDYYKNFIKI